MSLEQHDDRLTPAATPCPRCQCGRCLRRGIERQRRLDDELIRIARGLNAVDRAVENWRRVNREAA
jgi:hypothetical protein